MKEVSEERTIALYIDLPNLIHDILIKSAFDFGNSKECVEQIAEEIKKISNAEINSTLDMISKL